MFMRFLREHARHILCACSVPLCLLLHAPDAAAQAAGADGGDVAEATLTLVSGTSSSTTLTAAGAYYMLTVAIDLRNQQLYDEAELYNRLVALRGYVDENEADIQDALALCEADALHEMSLILGRAWGAGEGSCGRVRALRHSMTAALSVPSDPGTLARARAVREALDSALAPLDVAEVTR